MNGMQTSRRMREKRLSNLMAGVFALVLLVCVTVQIAMASRISGQAKATAALEREIRDLSASADNLNLSLNQYHNLERIAVRARQLGMEQPSETQIRVVNLPITLENTSTQSAENVGAEEILN